MIKVVMILLVALVATGCSTRNVKSDFTFDNSKQTGVLFMSVTQPWHSTSDAALTKIKFDGAKEGYVTSQEESLLGGGISLKAMLTFKKNRDFPELRGRVIAVELPVGSYEFYNWSVSTGNAHIYPIVEPPKIPFEITGGEITYAGNYHLEPVDGENILGGKSLAALYPVVTNRITRDLKVLNKKFPKLAGSKVAESMAYRGLWIDGSAQVARDIAPVYVPPAQ